MRRPHRRLHSGCKDYVLRSLAVQVTGRALLRTLALRSCIITYKGQLEAVVFDRAAAGALPSADKLSVYRISLFPCGVDASCPLPMWSRWQSPAWRPGAFETRREERAGVRSWQTGISACGALRTALDSIDWQLNKVPVVGVTALPCLWSLIEDTPACLTLAWAAVYSERVVVLVRPVIIAALSCRRRRGAAPAPAVLAVRVVTLIR